MAEIEKNLSSETDILALEKPISPQFEPRFPLEVACSLLGLVGPQGEPRVHTLRKWLKAVEAEMPPRYVVQKDARGKFRKLRIMAGSEIRRLAEKFLTERQRKHLGMMIGESGQRFFQPGQVVTREMMVWIATYIYERKLDVR
jgi:hypothetical protein